MFKAIINTSWPKLILISSSVGTFTAAMGILAHRQREKFLEKTPFLKASLDLVKRKEIFDILGTDNPKFGRPSLAAPWSKVDDKIIKLSVPIKGDKDKATLYITAERKDTSEKYRVTNLVLQFRGIKGKKLIVLDEPLDDIIAKEDGKVEDNQNIKVN